MQNKFKIYYTAESKLKQKSLLDVHDNLMNVIYDYLNCNPIYQNAYKAKLINQYNITQYFVQALQKESTLKQYQNIKTHYQTILDDLNKIPKHKPYINQLIQNYRAALIYQKLKLTQYEQQLKVYGSQKQNQKYLLEMVEGIAKSRNKDQFQLKNYQSLINKGVDINIDRKYNKYSTTSNRLNQQMNKYKYPTKSQIQLNQDNNIQNILSKYFWKIPKFDKNHLYKTNQKVYIKEKYVNELKSNYKLNYQDSIDGLYLIQEKNTNNNLFSADKRNLPNILFANNIYHMHQLNHIIEKNNRIYVRSDHLRCLRKNYKYISQNSLSDTQGNYYFQIQNT